MLPASVFIIWHGRPLVAHRDENGMSAPTSARGDKPEAICSIWDLSFVTPTGHYLHLLRVLFDPSSGLHIHWQTSTGVFACVSTLFVTLPIRSMESPPRPCDDITMRSQPLSSAAAMMA